MTFPIMYCFGVPSSCALMKSPAAGMKVRSVPATMPGADSGRVTRRNACRELAYRSSAASSSRGVDLLEGDVDRQRHEGQEVVGDPGDDGERGREEAAVGAEDVEVAEDADDGALVGEDVEPGERPHEVA